MTISAEPSWAACLRQPAQRTGDSFAPDAAEPCAARHQVLPPGGKIQQPMTMALLAEPVPTEPASLEMDVARAVANESQARQQREPAAGGSPCWPCSLQPSSPSPWIEARPWGGSGVVPTCTAALTYADNSGKRIGEAPTAPGNLDVAFQWGSRQTAGDPLPRRQHR